MAKLGLACRVYRLPNNGLKSRGCQKTIKQGLFNYASATAIVGFICGWGFPKFRGTLFEATHSKEMGPPKKQCGIFACESAAC